MRRFLLAKALAVGFAIAPPAFAEVPKAPIDGAPVSGLTGFAHHYAKVNGVRIHYVSGGRGPVVLFVHGWPYSWYEWKEVIPKIAAAGYCAIAIDMPGYGDSDGPEKG